MILGVVYPLQEENDKKDVPCVFNTRLQYGKVALSKSKCPNCKEQSFLVDGKTVCCGSEVEETTARRLIKVTDRPAVRRFLTAQQKMNILIEQNHECFYCGHTFYDTWFMTGKMRSPSPLKPEFDHIVPKAFTDNQYLTNFVAACHICNMVKKDRVFNDIHKLKEYVKTKREKLKFVIVSDKED